MSSLKLYVTVGCSGSGKTTYVKNKLKDFVNINNDDLRRSMFSINHWEEYDFRKNESLINVARENLVELCLANHKNTVISNVHLSGHWISHCHRLNRTFRENHELVFLIFDEDLETCLERNSKRTEMKLKDSVIENQYKRFQVMKNKVINSGFKYQIIKNGEIVYDSSIC